MSGWASFSRDRRYRYSLGRSWGDGPRVCWLLLNPSTADARDDDRTLRRCVAFARAWGAGSVEVVNLFAFVATRPSDLPRAADASGAANRQAVRRALGRADWVVAGWGNVPAPLAAAARRSARALPGPVWCLGLTGSGHPRHPLYVASATPLRPFKVPR
ncbi:MAG: DUF1643 domain-containing protein [Dehalococcoidia bacterium]|nr:MAG: DUF1643 domain-containing protein [Dehalococcoidia bacterium]